MMKHSIFLRLYILLQLTIYCNLIVQAQVPKIIDIESGMNRPGNLVLSDIVDDIQYIPLETNEYNLISYVDKLIFIDQFLFVQNASPPSLHIFDHNGKYISKIGTKGRGPKEYNYLFDFTFSSFKQQVWLLTGVPHKIMVYTFNGVLLNQIKYSDPDCFSRIESLLKDKYLIMRTNDFGNTPFTYNIFSDDNKLIKNTIRPEQFKYPGSVFGMDNSFCFYEFDNNYYVKANVLNDTIYRISSSLEFLPQYFFDLGKYKQTLEFRHNFTEYFNRNAIKFILFDYIFETSNALIYSYFFDKKNHYDYYDKTIKKSFTFNNEGIPNDLDGGIDFFPKYQINNKWISYVNALDLILYIESDAFKNSTPKYPEKKKALEKLANSLNENDNPVLMLVKLKE